MAVAAIALKQFVPGDRRSPARRRPLLAAAAIGLLGCLAITLAVRRLAGALIQPLSPAALLACAAITLLAAIVLVGLVRDLRLSNGRKALVQVAVVLLLLIVAGSLSLPGSNTLALGVLWLAASLPALVMHGPWQPWSGKFLPHPLPDSSPPRCEPAAVLSTPGLASETGAGNVQLAAINTLSDEAADIEPEAFDPHIVQQVTRVRGDCGEETVTGWCRVEFAPQQRQAASHLAFCPPLAHTPVVELEQLDGPQARLKAGQTLAHGMRVELKLLDAPAEPCEVVFRFEAR